MDISKLAREFDLDPEALEAALTAARDLVDQSRQNVRPANKKALRGVAKAFEKVLTRLSDGAMAERLREAACKEPDNPDEHGLAHYLARCDARERVDSALAGAQDLLNIVRAGEAYSLSAARPKYEHWPVAANSLLYFWQEQGRAFTISAHPTGAKAEPSETLRFTHHCLQYLGEEVTMEACRTILGKLRESLRSPATAFAL